MRCELLVIACPSTMLLLGGMQSPASHPPLVLCGCYAARDVT